MIIFLIIITIICFVVLLFLHEVFEKELKNGLLCLLLVSSVGLGVKLQQAIGVSDKTPITPKIRIECANGICDTTYIYEKKK